VAAPGQSPFRIKGLAYRGVLHQLDARFGGRGPLLAELADPALVAFFDQPFLAASWYDVLPIVALCQAAARLCKVDFDAFVREHTHNQAQEDLGGVYRLILTVVSPELALRALIKVTERYYDFGKTELHELRPGHAVTTRSDVPDVLLDWYDIVAVEYTRAVLEHAGARDVRVVPSRGARKSISLTPVTELRFEMDWRR
jgi:hypothetical protein